jgi:hypothetical protein
MTYIQTIIRNATQMGTYTPAEIRACVRTAQRQWHSAAVAQCRMVAVNRANERRAKNPSRGHA